MLYQALYVPPGTDPLPPDIVYHPDLAKYASAWGKAGDMGAIAVSPETQDAIGAAWLRLFQQSNPGYGYINDETPELTITVLPPYRHQGTGTALLNHLFEQATGRYAAVSLSVSVNNPALRLYRRFGFEAVAQAENSLTMQKLLTP
ncbi:MAG: GNAT family N-acetyltransferase [Leptolyngbya sp. SIO1E4]|nr:GNAT family N-acetyltransferase [Leptolyngbya sp. SIO1E4]